MFFLLTDKISRLPGVGPKVEEKLGKLGIFDISDLVYYYPRKWDDLSKILPISKLKQNTKITIKATLTNFSQFRTPQKNLLITSGLLNDSTGNIEAIWFNQPYLMKTLKKGYTYYFSGEAKLWKNKLSLVNPVFEDITESPLHTGRIVQTYPETAGLTSKFIRKIIKNLLLTIRKIDDPLPKKIIKTNSLMSFADAIENIHFPASPKLLQQAKARLSFDEIFLLQLSLLFSKTNWESNTSSPIKKSLKIIDEIKNNISFELTPSQIKSTKQILTDLNKSNQPMNRLLLGDVGSGKTIVAIAAIIATSKAGFQTAFMAPTEVLANQHYQGLKNLLDNWEIRTALITSNSKLTINLDSVDVFIGTHALLQDKIKFKKLNLIIVDEQHRFGVVQRSKLKKRTSGNYTPHYLSLSATPIPRTIFLSLFSDLDVSTLDSIPKGRLPVITRLITNNNEEKAFSLITKEIGLKHKVFVINPIIEESKRNLSSINSVATNFKEKFPQAKIGILHGKLPSIEKINIMENFKNGNTNILIATTVIEVGIDIPDATIIWIKGAENFGLATLHQLRGRVGRSILQSYCFVETNKDEQENLERLIMFIKTNNGTKLAEADLALRGPGAFFNTKQSGYLKLKIADLTNTKLINQAHKEAKKIMDEDSLLKKYPTLKKQILTNLITHSE